MRTVFDQKADGVDMPTSRGGNNRPMPLVLVDRVHRVHNNTPLEESFDQFH